MGNPGPVFASSNLQLGDVRSIGQNQKHLKLKLNQQQTISDVIVAWNLGDPAKYCAVTIISILRLYRNLMIGKEAEVCSFVPVTYNLKQIKQHLYQSIVCRNGATSSSDPRPHGDALSPRLPFGLRILAK